MPLVLPCLALQCTCFNFRFQGIMWKFEVTNFCQVPSALGLRRKIQLTSLYHGCYGLPSNDCYMQELIWQTSSLDTRSSIGCHIWSSSAVNGCHPCLWLFEMGPSMGRHTRHGICCSFFLSLSSSLKSSTFLREKHHYLNESITIFPSNDIFFTQYLFLNKKKVTFSWRLESKRTRGKSNHKFRNALAENEETENFDGAEAVPNPEPQQILNAEADADPA